MTKFLDDKINRPGCGTDFLHNRLSLGSPMTRLNLSTVRQNFAAIVERVRAGEIIIVTRYGKDLAAIVPMSFLAQR